MISVRNLVAASPRARLWFTIIVLTAIDAYAFMDATILALLVDPVKRDLHASDLDMGLMLGAAYAALYGIFAIPAGHYVDHFNRKRMIAAASVVWALMTVVCGTAQSLTQLFIGRVGIGVSSAVLMPAIFSIIRDAMPQQTRGVAFSIYAMSPMIGSGMALLGGSALLRLAGDGAFSAVPLIGALHPWQQTMTILGIGGLPLSVLLLFAIEPARCAAPEKQHRMLLRDLMIAVQYMNERRRLFLPLLGFAVFATMESFAVGSWLPAALSRHLGATPESVGPTLGILYFTCGIAGLSLTALALGLIVRREKSPMTFGALLCLATALSAAAAVLMPNATASYLFAGLCYVTLGTSFAVGAAALADITDDMLMGRVSAIYFLFQNLLGQSLGPVIVPVVGSLVFAGPRSLSYAFSASLMGFALLAALAAVTLGRRTLDRSAH